MKKLGKNNGVSIVKERKKHEIADQNSLIKARPMLRQSERPRYPQTLLWDVPYHFQRFEQVRDRDMQGVGRSIWGQSGDLRGP